MRVPPGASAGVTSHEPLVPPTAVILQAWSETQPTAEYIKAAFAVKDDWLAAVEANPSDARAWHLLGRWAQAVAAMPYWKRSIAVSERADEGEGQGGQNRMGSGVWE